MLNESSGLHNTRNTFMCCVHDFKYTVTAVHFNLLKIIGIQLQQCGPLIEIGLMPSHHSHGFRVEIRRNQISISKLNGALDPFDMADFGQHDRIWDSFMAYVNH